MNIIDLKGITAEGKECHVWACGVCQMAKRSRDEAEQCCLPAKCKCGKELTRYQTFCDACRKLEYQRQDQERYDKAKKVKYADYTGPGFFVDGDECYDHKCPVRDILEDKP